VRQLVIKVLNIVDARCNHEVCFHRANWHSPASLTEVFSVLFAQFYGKCQGIPHKDWARSALFLISELCCSVYCFMLIILCHVLFVCKCVLYSTVLYCCHRVSTQLQLNISYSNEHTNWFADKLLNKVTWIDCQNNNNNNYNYYYY